MFGISEDAAKTLLKKWLKEEVLEVFEYEDPVARRMKNGVRSVPRNRPDRKPQQV
jgi:hypothetical protein